MALTAGYGVLVGTISDYYRDPPDQEREGLPVREAFDADMAKVVRERAVGRP